MLETREVHAICVNGILRIEGVERDVTASLAAAKSNIGDIAGSLSTGNSDAQLVVLVNLRQRDGTKGASEALHANQPPAFNPPPPVLGIMRRLDERNEILPL